MSPQRPRLPKVELLEMSSDTFLSFQITKFPTRVQFVGAGRQGRLKDKMYWRYLYLFK